MRQMDLFDDLHPFHDPHIAAYHKFLARELSDDGVRAFMAAKFSYNQFQEKGTAEHRRNAWLYTTLAARKSTGKPAEAKGDR